MPSVVWTVFGWTILISLFVGGRVAWRQWRDTVEENVRVAEAHRFKEKMEAAATAAREYQTAARLLTEPPRNEGTARVVERVEARARALSQEIEKAAIAAGVTMPEGWKK